jgi:hypothetical protein
MKNLKFAFLLSLLGSFTLSSCLKDNSDWTFEQDNSVSSELFQDIYKQVDVTAQSDGSLKSCGTVTLSNTLGTFPNTVIIDFGNGCVGTDGRMRSGQIIGIFSGRWRDAGTVVNITTNNYKVNKYAVSGSQTITNNGLNTSNHLSYTVVTANGQVRDTTNNQTIQWNSTKTFEWVAGQGTSWASNGVLGITDDIYHVTGSASGINRNGTPYTAVITERLVRDLSCRWITDGTVEITPQNGDTRTLDFGDGACDANVRFSFRRWTFNFILP